jgi:hypothetical protein
MHLVLFALISLTLSSNIAVTPVLYLGALLVRNGFGARHFWLNPFRRFVSFLFGNHE